MMEFASLSSLFLPVLISLPLMAAYLSHTTRAWQIAEILSASSLLGTVLAWISVVGFGFIFNFGDWLEATSLRATLLLLVSFISYIVLRYARMNFNSDIDSDRFLKWLMLTIFAVMLTLLSNHLIIFWCAWTSISLSMHKLINFHPYRYRAVLAAHKKFMFARLAELCLAAAFLLLYHQHHSFLISEILQQYPHSQLAWQAQYAAILLAIVALIKCAQLPLHGWLIQVVESPTPVSALLHAGVINLGGILLLIFAPLFSQVVAAHWLVLIVAGLTATFASLVMMTRISIKVRLAWSTTAQMGLMLVECALGLYALALLHLVAHSCYKAYAFLSAGNAVSDDIQNQYTGKSQASKKIWCIAAVLSVFIVTCVNFFIAIEPPYSPWIVLSIALMVGLALPFHLSVSFFKCIFDAVLLVGLYLLLKQGTGLLLPHIEHTYNWLADAWIAGLFIIVLIIYLFLEFQPLNPYARRLFIAFNAGFYLDEWSTRLSLRIWPIRLPKQDARHVKNFNFNP